TEQSACLDCSSACVPQRSRRQARSPDPPAHWAVLAQLEPRADRFSPPAICPPRLELSACPCDYSEILHCQDCWGMLLSAHYHQPPAPAPAYQREQEWYADNSTELAP